MSSKTVKLAIILARTKGLRVCKNSIKEGWCVILPNNASYHASTDVDMVNYVKGY